MLVNVKLHNIYTTCVLWFNFYNFMLINIYCVLWLNFYNFRLINISINLNVYKHKVIKIQPETPHVMYTGLIFITLLINFYCVLCWNFYNFMLINMSTNLNVY